MTQEPNPRGPMGPLLDDAKTASGLDWRDVESGSGIPLATIQGWTSGRTGEPPLRGFLHLAKFLGVTPQDVMNAALTGYVPPLKERASVARGVAGGSTSREGSAEVASVRAAAQAKGQRQSRRSRRPPGA